MGQQVEEPAAAVAEQDSNNIIEQQLDDRLDRLEKVARADVITYIGAMYPPADDLVKEALEGIKKRTDTTGKRRKLLFVLETPGGLIDVVERIARITRHHYRYVEFLVPGFAMSAGTILVMSGDAIHMDYASVLGPIDPQVRNDDRHWVPALGYLEQYKAMVKKSADGKLTTAELAYMIKRFDQAELYAFEQEKKLSITLLQDWLVRYKFKNWRETDKRKLPVTRQMKIDRAVKIAETLNDTSVWHSHSRGIPMEVLRRKLKLLIDDFGENEPLALAVHNYYRLLMDYQMRRGHFDLAAHTRGKYVGI